MDISQIASQAAAFLTPYIPQLLKIGRQAAQDDDSPERAKGWATAHKIWDKLFPNIETRPAAKEAAEDVAQAPDDDDSKAAFRKQTRKVLEKDTALAAEIAQILEDGGIAISGNSNIVQQGDDNVNIGTTQGDVTVGSGNKSFKFGGATVEGGVIASDSIESSFNTTTHIYQTNSGPDKKKITTLRQTYLKHHFQEVRQLSLTGIDPKATKEAEAQLLLDMVYTALLTITPERSDDFQFFLRGEKPDREMKHLSALDQLDRHQKLVLLGDPGSGKTTFVNFLTLCMTGEMLGQPANLALLTEPLPDTDGNDSKERQHWRHGSLLPVRIILRDYAARCLPGQKTPGCAQSICDFVNEELDRADLGDFKTHLWDGLKQHGGLILLDGLDEVPQADEHRIAIKEAVADFARTYDRCRIMVTSRTYAYQKENWKLDGFQEAVLTDFSRGQIIRFVEHWYAHIAIIRHMNPDDAKGRSQVLKNAILGNPNLLNLAVRPLLLTLMASLHAWRGGSLPEKREELYNDTVELLLDWWESPKRLYDANGTAQIQQSVTSLMDVEREQIKKLLQQIAFAVHSRQKDTTGTADIAENDLIGGLIDLNPEKKLKPKEIVTYLNHRSGILLPRGNKVYTFPHRTFQEYLAACYLTDQDFPEQVADLARSDPYRWREAALLSGAKAARGAAMNVWLLADALCYNPPAAPANNPDQWGALLAAQALTEVADLRKIPERHQQKYERVVEWLQCLIRTNDFPAIERVAAGRHLAVLGDPREQVTTVDQMQFCYVPGGPFLLGDEKKTCEVLDKPYWIGRFPVTVAQFKEFIDRSGLKGYDEDCLKDPLNNPVRWVSWHEAMKFCDWLTEVKWKGLLPDGYRVILPAEIEWEKASRGGEMIPDAVIYNSIGEITQLDSRQEHAGMTLRLTANTNPGRRYSWGDEADPNLANCDDTGIGATSAVGCFSGGMSPYGCEEMNGNVWEWTRSIYKSYPYDPDDGREKLDSTDSRVLRGGAGRSTARVTTCARPPVATTIRATTTATSVFGYVCLPFSIQVSDILDSVTLTNLHSDPRGARRENLGGLWPRKWLFLPEYMS